MNAQEVTNAGIDSALSAPVANDSFVWPGMNPESVEAHVENASAAAITVTVHSQAQVSEGEAKQNKIVSIPAGGGRRFRISRAYIRGNDNTVLVDFSAVASVTAGIFWRRD